MGVARWEVISLKRLCQLCHLLDAKWEPGAGAGPEAQEIPRNWYIQSKTVTRHPEFTVCRTARQSHFVRTDKVWSAWLWKLENKSLSRPPKLDKWSRSRRTAITKESGMVVYPYNPSTREEKAKGSWPRDFLCLYIEFKASLGKPVSKYKRKPEREWKGAAMDTHKPTWLSSSLFICLRR